MRRAVYLALAFALAVPLATSPAAAQTGSAAGACRAAARALVRQLDVNMDQRRSGGGYGVSDVLYWRASDGTVGICQLDRRGRVYEVRVERFGNHDEDVDVWPGDGWDGGGRQTQTLTCESDRNRYRECSIRRGGRARLIRRLSDAPCISGRTWGTGGGVLWVDNGCRGVFEVSW